MSYLWQTKIDSSVSSSEFLPCGYKDDIRRDREEGGVGDIMIATKVNITIQPVTINSKCESSWGKISLKDKSDVYIGCFYRHPNEYTPTQVEDLEQDLRHIKALTRNNDRASQILGGDFNAREIDWNTYIVTPESTIKPLCEKFLSVFTDFNLDQLQRELTRGNMYWTSYVQTNPVQQNWPTPYQSYLTTRPLFLTATSGPGLPGESLGKFTCTLKPTGTQFVRKQEIL